MKTLKQIFSTTLVLCMCVVFCACPSDKNYEDLDPPLTENEETLTISGNIDGHDYVDLGLSVKWATMNLDAHNPQDDGGYYAWGETSTKSSYTDKNYKFYDASKSGIYFKKLGNDISGTQYDAARVKWGGSWRMPSDKEWEEIWTKCTHEWVVYRGVEGFISTGPNGNSIFIPATGFFVDSELERVGPYSKSPWGSYWSSTYYNGSYYGSETLINFEAYAFRFANWEKDDKISFYPEGMSRYYGLSIRPVSSKNDGGSNGENDNEDTGEAPQIVNYTFTSTQNSITVKFYTDVSITKATIKYGTSATSVSKSTTETVASHCATATVKNLKSGTKYYFKCTVKNNYGSTTSDVYPAMTNY